MKKLLTVLVVALLTLSVVMTTACSGEPSLEVERVKYNEYDKRVEIYYSDGSVMFYEDYELGIKTVVYTEVNEEKHLIIWYGDGTSEDVGFIGDAIRVYTVTFVDVDGNEISKQQVYEGLSAFAPEAPSIKDKEFAGWNKEFTNVQRSLTVQATYREAKQ